MSFVPPHSSETVLRPVRGPMALAEGYRASRVGARIVPRTSRATPCWAVGRGIRRAERHTSCLLTQWVKLRRGTGSGTAMPACSAERGSTCWRSIQTGLERVRPYRLITPPTSWQLANGRSDGGLRFPWGSLAPRSGPGGGCARWPEKGARSARPCSRRRSLHSRRSGGTTRRPMLRFGRSRFYDPRSSRVSDPSGRRGASSVALMCSSSTVEVTASRRPNTGSVLPTLSKQERAWTLWCSPG